MSGIEENFKTERTVREVFQPPIGAWLRSQGATRLKVYPSGCNALQFKGDVEFCLKEKILRADFKGEKKMWGKLNHFFETWSDMPGNKTVDGRRGWGSNRSYDLIWYCFYEISMMTVLALPPWDEMVEAALVRGDRRIRCKIQTQYKQDNQTQGIICPLPWILAQDVLRAKEGKATCLRAVMEIKGDTMHRWSPDEGVTEALRRMDTPKNYKPWPANT